MLKSPLFWKMTTLFGAVLLLLIPIMLIRQVIVERADYRSDVEDAIRQSTSGPQKLVGPLIAIPVTELYTVQEEDKTVERKRSFIHFWLPESLMVDGNQNVEERKIGIYTGQVWHSDLTLKADFDVSRLSELNAPKALTIEPGTGLEQGGQGVHIPLPEGDWRKQNLKLNMALNLSGTGDLSVVPAGRNSEMTLTSNWPHPSFLGDFLPAKREVSESGFQAQWQSSWFANNLGERFASGNDTGWENFPAFSVAVTTPADQYQLTDRATKYAILLIALTFMAFFVFETLTAQRLHPMQYLLVGLSLVMFYLLLLALSEHIGFTVAWIIASLIGALMNGIYLQAVLKGWRNSMLFTLALLLLDGVMWGLLNSADSALLLGTSVLVVALAGMMFVTRNIDWYAFSLPKMKASKEVTMDDQLRIWK
ncbi:cell envelope integrity protein CreD [Shigella flexneri]|uniref:cell envelope integrity protein CreD n=1 Tax=Shigella flexneri TaxID=623 RepID=UPI0011001F41|nr:cell envelope integrity protein CreD [Shigella flexneri]MBF0741520.1 cell envelope integrity protein CreD [Shigella flexneri]TFU73975.1 cell envelope integrity protein CreD [Shigella flexneri]